MIHLLQAQNILTTWTVNGIFLFRLYLIVSIIFYDQTLRQHVLFLADASAVLTSTAASHPMKLIAWRPAIQIQTVDGSPTTTSPSSANW